MIIVNENAVSDVIGVLLLISVVTVAMGIVMVSLTSNISVHDVPNIDILAQKNPDNTMLYLLFERGESLSYDSTAFRVNLEDVDSNALFIKKSGSSSIIIWDNSNLFSIGDILIWEPIDPMDVENARVVDIIHLLNPGEILLQRVEFV